MIVGIAVAVAVAWNGAADLEPRVLLHGLLLVGCAIAATLPSAVLAESGRAMRVTLPALAVLVVATLGLVPLPASVLAWIAPGTAAAFPGMTHGAAIDAPQVVTALGVIVLATGAAVLTALSLRPDRRRGVRVERYGAVAILVITTIAFAQHAFAGELLYGIWPVRTEVGAAWAPLINGNFDAFLVVGLLPLVVGGVVNDANINKPWTWACGVAAVAAVVLLLMVGALGAFVGLAVASAVAVARWATPRSRALSGLVVVSAFGLLAAIGASLPRWAPSWTEASVTNRLNQWSGTLDLAGDHLLFGVGPGGYATAFPPYQHPYRFVRFDHVHSDPLEALVEIGFVGVLLVGAALIFVPRPRSRALAHRGSWLELGLVAWLVHSWVDFPLHMPGLLLVVVCVATVRVVGWSRPRPVPPVVARSALIGLAVLQLVGMAWTTHAAVVDRSARALRADPPDNVIVDRLAWMAPWRMEPVLARARAAARSGDVPTATALAEQVAAKAPHDADLLYQAGAVLTHVRALDRADAVLTRAITRHAADHRARALASRVAQARGDKERAIALWAEALNRWPYDAMVAQRPFERALQLQPEGLWWVEQLDDGASGYLVLRLANTLLERGDPASALLAFEAGAAVDNRIEHFPERGLALVQIGLVDEGLAFMAKADEHDTNGTARRLRARTLLELGRPEEAREDAKRALAKDNGHPESVALRIRSEAAVDGPLAAVDVADRITPSVATADPAVALIVAEYAASAGLYSECVRWLEAHDTRLTSAGRSLLTRCQTDRGLGGGSP